MMEFQTYARSLGLQVVRWPSPTGTEWQRQTFMWMKATEVSKKQMEDHINARTWARMDESGTFFPRQGPDDPTLSKEQKEAVKRRTKTLFKIEDKILPKQR